MAQKAARDAASAAREMTNTASAAAGHLLMKVLPTANGAAAVQLNTTTAAIAIRPQGKTPANQQHRCNPHHSRMLFYAFLIQCTDKYSGQWVRWVQHRCASSTSEHRCRLDMSPKICVRRWGRTENA